MRISLGLIIIVKLPMVKIKKQFTILKMSVYRNGEKLTVSSKESENINR